MKRPTMAGLPKSRESSRKTSGGPTSAMRPVARSHGPKRRSAPSRGKSRTARAPSPVPEHGERGPGVGDEELSGKQPRPGQFQCQQGHGQQGHDEANRRMRTPPRVVVARAKVQGQGSPQLAGAFPAAAAPLPRVTGGRHDLYLGGRGPRRGSPSWEARVAETLEH